LLGELLSMRVSYDEFVDFLSGSLFSLIEAITMPLGTLPALEGRRTCIDFLGTTGGSIRLLALGPSVLLVFSPEFAYSKLTYIITVLREKGSGVVDREFC